MTGETFGGGVGAVGAARASSLTGGTAAEPVAVGDLLGVSPAVRRASWPQLDALTAHAIARLRVDVLVAEAGSAHTELDLLDLVGATEHLWVPDGEVPVAYLRVVRDAGGVPVVDRVCARRDVRGLGLVGALVADVVARHGAGTIRAVVPAEVAGDLERQAFECTLEVVTGQGGGVALVRRAESPWRY